MRHYDTLLFCPVQSVRKDGIPEGSGSSQDVLPTTGTIQQQVMQVEDLNDIVQSFVQKSLID